jgi:translation initiation factor IF-1
LRGGNQGRSLGVDQTLKVQARVLEELPSLLYRLELDNQKRVLAHPAGAAQINFVRLLPGDRVEVELGSSDLTRGRITRKL